MICLFEIAPYLVCILTDDINTISVYLLGTPFQMSNMCWSFILEGDHILFSPHENSGVIDSNVHVTDSTDMSLSKLWEFGMLQSMGSQRVRHTTEWLNWTELTQMLFPTLSVANISFSLEPLCKILQRTKVLQNFIKKRNRCLIEHSVVTTITGNKLIDIGVNVQNLIANSWWNFFFTTSPTTQKWFSVLFNPLLVSLIIFFLLGCLKLLFDL